MSGSVLLCVRVPPDPRYHEFLVSKDLVVGGAIELMARLASTSFEGCPPVDEGAELMLVEGSRAGMLLNRASSVWSLVAHGVLFDGVELVMV